MSINNLNTYLNVRDAHLRVVSGNVYAQAMNIGGINVETAHGLQSVSNTGNATSLTLEFANVTTGFVTTANAQIGRDLVVTGNTTVSKELTVTSNAIVSSNLNVSDDLVVTNNILASNNLTVTGNLHVTTIMSDSNVVTEYTGPHDRPLRKYPEVAMTSDSQGGYVVTPSTQNATHVAYHMFDGDRSTRWVARGSTDSYNSSSPYLYNGSNSSSISDTSGTSHDGAFLKLELPTAIKLDYTIIRENSDPASRTPGKITFLGSTNGTDWTFLKEFSGMSNTALDETYTINDTNYYNHFAFVVKNLSDGDGVLDLGEWELYGYEEGSGSLDTTLKSVYNVPATTGTQLEVYYDGRETSSYSGSGTTVTDISPNTNNGTLNGGVGFDSTYKAFTFDGTDDYILTDVTNPEGAFVHSVSTWVKADTMTSANDNITQIGSPGSDDHTKRLQFCFVDIDGVPGQINMGLSGSSVKFKTNLQVGVWYHLVYTYNGGAAGAGSTSYNVYVNGVSIPVHTGSGTGVLNLDANAKFAVGGHHLGTTGFHFNGSIANFRLYSKALNAGQVQELYDYQKDYFLGSKSQVTLYKGHLGVGVTEPSGQLELAGDERIQEYPPGPMSDYDTHIPGHGVFCAYAGDASAYSGSPHFFHAWKAFDDSNDIYHGGNRYTGTDRAYVGSIQLHGQGIKGDYIVLEMPYQIKVQSVTLGNNGTRQPKDFTIVGSNDGLTWTTVKSISGAVFSSTLTNFPLNGTEYFSKIAIIVTRLQNDSYWNQNHIKFFGTPGPTTLDKGSLTLGRSLDVPRVSRYDVDTETPRPEKLILDLDTTVNSSPTDISGKGNHGTFEGGAKISEADKAFTGATPSSGFNGISNYIRGNLSGVSGAYAHTQSYWINGADTTPRAAFTVGKEAGSYSYLNIWLTTSQWTLNSDGAASGVWAETIYDNRWYHVVLTYDGGTSTDSYKLYIDGEYKTPTTAITVNAALALPSNPEYRIGRNDGTQWYNGMVSSPKVWSVALEPSEVKKLYNLGRTGRSMVISDTAVGIGKVPEAQLDVRGSARFDTFTDMLRIDHPGNQLSIGRSDHNKNEFRWYAWGNGCNWFTPFTGKSIYIGRDGQTISEFDFFNVTTVKRGSSIISSSDDRLKRDEAFITNATDTLLKLKPQTYIKKHRLPENENENSDDIPEQFEAGLIAQDVWYDAPELKFLVHPSKDANPSETKPVSPDPNDPTQDPDYSSWGTTQAYINYEGLIPYLIKATQEQYEKTQSIKSELNIIRELQNENTRLKNKVAILENRQTHFNTLLVNLTGRIETLERGA